ncbi:hypothetical protein RchiOBHm_Chr7g0187211 [Rosa chinensis]|uniref:Uncharacterized protein n=1 Tax=Rosa chinensis TaxID=74649 RepID=A0A2P6P453_ROSCH|nr:hypothetical protein RchiOBHm_Chr7g0187211 [Rosa chinensis]
MKKKVLMFRGEKKTDEEIAFSLCFEVLEINEVGNKVASLNLIKLSKAGQSDLFILYS